MSCGSWRFDCLSDKVDWSHGIIYTTKVGCDWCISILPLLHSSDDKLFHQQSALVPFSCSCVFWLWVSMLQEFQFHYPCWCRVISRRHCLKTTSSKQLKHCDLHLKWLHCAGQTIIHLIIASTTMNNNHLFLTLFVSNYLLISWLWGGLWTL